MITPPKWSLCLFVQDEPLSLSRALHQQTCIHYIRSPNFHRYFETGEMRVRSLSVSIFLGGKVEEIIGFVLFTTKSKCWRIFEKRPPISLERGWLCHYCRGWQQGDNSITFFRTIREYWVIISQKKSGMSECFVCRLSLFQSMSQVVRAEWQMANRPYYYFSELSKSSNCSSSSVWTPGSQWISRQSWLRDTLLSSDWPIVPDTHSHWSEHLYPVYPGS